MMTREILFRGFHKDENGKETIYLNGEEIKGNWVYGYLVKQNENEFYICEDIDSACLVIPETVSQYTGLDDKNGKKIFENDVVLYNTSSFGELDKRKKSVVVYDIKWNKFVVFENGVEGWGVNQYLYNIEVIGTIFDEKEVE